MNTCFVILSAYEYKCNCLFDISCRRLLFLIIYNQPIRYAPTSPRIDLVPIVPDPLFGRSAAFLRK